MQVHIILNSSQIETCVNLPKIHGERLQNGGTTQRYIVHHQTSYVNSTLYFLIDL